MLFFKKKVYNVNYYSDKKNIDVYYGWDRESIFRYIINCEFNFIGIWRFWYDFY